MKAGRTAEGENGVSRDFSSGFTCHAEAERRQMLIDFFIANFPRQAEYKFV
jgi:hypothetical protein